MTWNKYNRLCCIYRCSCGRISYSCRCDAVHEEIIRENHCEVCKRRERKTHEREPDVELDLVDMMELE